MPISSLEDIQDFLSQKRLALVGLSRNPEDFTRAMFRELWRQSYDVVPINPNMTEVDGIPCFARLQDVPLPVDGALVMTPAAQSERVVRDCAEAGITRVWLHRGVGTGSVNQAAVDFCRQQGIRLVAGYCPYMFLPKTPFFHRAHGVLLKLTGGYPVHASR
jgi:uncharacterized protein